MLTKRKRRILFYGSIAIFAAVLFPIILYSLGYGITRSLQIKKTGGIYIEASEGGADVFAEGKHKRTSLIGKSALIKNLLPGAYKVSVEKEGFWKWEKTLDVSSKMVEARNVLLMPKNIDGEVLGTSSPEIVKLKPPLPSVKKFWLIPNTPDFLILGEDKKFYRNKDQFNVEKNFGAEVAEILIGKKQSVFDETFSRLIYWDGSVIDSFWFEDRDKMPQWQKEPHQRIGPLRPAGAIRQVFSYPDWPDWLLVEMSNGVFALEMDISGGQNVFPIYKGKKPEIASLEPDTIIIKDDGNFLKITLP